MKSKKSQFFILSALFYILLLVFIYSLETENSYIVDSDRINLLDNIVYETCQLGYHSGTSEIDSRYGNFSANVSSYCTTLGYSCNLSISLNTASPPVYNYTTYDYSISYQKEGLLYSKTFTC